MQDIMVRTAVLTLERPDFRDNAAWKLLLAEGGRLKATVREEVKRSGVRPRTTTSTGVCDPGVSMLHSWYKQPGMHAGKDCES